MRVVAAVQRLNALARDDGRLDVTGSRSRSARPLTNLFLEYCLLLECMYRQVSCDAPDLFRFAGPKDRVITQRDLLNVRWDGERRTHVALSALKAYERHAGACQGWIDDVGVLVTVLV